MVGRPIRTLAVLVAALLALPQWDCPTRASTPAALGRPAALAQFRRPADGIPFPETNPFTPAKFELGRTLFFEPGLSKSGSTSCATCHNPSLSWTDGLPRSIGDNGAAMVLRAPTLFNAAWLPRLGWDGKFRDIEQVTFAAISGAANMALDPDTALRRLAAIPGYPDAFAAAFGDPAVTRERVEQAVSTFERTLVSGPAPFDRWVEGDDRAVGEDAKLGFQLFVGQAGCAGCHSGWAFTDGSFHDIGVATGEDIGRGRLFRSSVKLQYAFKVPTLRDVARRGPYMHDGSVPSLEEVIELYDRGGIDRPSRSPEIKPLGLSPAQKADLVAFLRTLTSDPVPLTVPELPR